MAGDALERPVWSDPLERVYAELGRLPAGLFVPVVAHPVGGLSERALGILAWREALLAGTLPQEDVAVAWVPDALRSSVVQAIEALGVVPFCRGEPELVELVLRDLLVVVERASADLERKIAEHLAALRAKQRGEWEPPEAAASSGGGGHSTDAMGSRTGETRGAGPDSGSGEGWVDSQGAGEAPGEGEPAEAVSEARRRALEQVAAELTDRLDARWTEQVRAWRTLADALGDLRSALALGWDLARRVLRDAGWREVSKFQELIEQVPQLREIVRILGRMSAPRGAERSSVIAEVVDPVRRVVEELRLVRSPRAPTEARGIERSDDLPRMLPTEAALLGHPQLRLLWHSRRAERGLATYRLEGQVEERVRVQASAAPVERPSHVRPERGPVILCLDTSGSMQGAPEQIAKALTLAVARAAHAEGRACRVVLFSGPGDVEQLEVNLGPEGLPSLLRLLRQSFSGGTDVDWPLRIALDTLDEHGWERADLLIVSDGAFDVPGGLVERIAHARATHRARVHGLLIGVRPSPAMEALCEPLHAFTDWAAVGGFDPR